jgi:hypothetical protein
MTEAGPQVIVIADPNGAGKTSLAPFLLRDRYRRFPFVNADTIASGLSAFEPESVAIEAGRVMLGRLHELSEKRHSFAFETGLGRAGRQSHGRICGTCYLSLGQKSDRLMTTREGHMRNTTNKADRESSNGRKTRRQTKTLRRFDLVTQAKEMEHILQQAVQHELSIHKRLGNPVAAWRDGKVVVIPPEEISISSEP